MNPYFDLCTTLACLWLYFFTQTYAQSLRGVLGLIGLAFVVALRVISMGLPIYALLFFLIYLGAVLVIFLLVLMTMNQNSFSLSPKKYLGLDFKKFLAAISMTCMNLILFYFYPFYSFSQLSQQLPSQKIAEELAHASAHLLIPLGIYLLALMITAISLFRNHKRELL